MSYRAKKEGSYGQNRRNRGKPPFTWKKTLKKDMFGLRGKTETIECSHSPSEINEEGRTSLGVNLGNQIGNIGFSGAKEHKTNTKFQKEKIRKPKPKKKAYI